MKYTDLRYQRNLQTNDCLRLAVAKAVNELQRLERPNQAAVDLHLLGAQLQAYALAANADVATHAAAPTVASRTGAFAAKTIDVNYSGPVTGTVNAAMFEITSPARVVESAVFHDADTIRITYAGAQLVTADTPELTFTNKGVTNAYGVPVGSFTAQAVTVAGS